MHALNHFCPEGHLNGIINSIGFTFRQKRRISNPYFALRIFCLPNCPLMRRHRPNNPPHSSIYKSRL
uniref:Uncharacterized protein n=1 Tax=Globodera rostochiensis TaxID=31243 RepID=A0A914H4N3_GLORO